MRLKSFSLGLTIMFILFGCSPESNEDTLENNVNYENVEKDLQEIDFDYKLPSKLPFEVLTKDVSSPSLSQPMFSIDYVGDGDNFLTLEVVQGEVNQVTNIETEDVTIGESTGKYFENDQGAKTLTWSNEGINYEITTKGESAVNKEDLKGIAESFE